MSTSGTPEKSGSVSCQKRDECEHFNNGINAGRITRTGLVTGTGKAWLGKPDTDRCRSHGGSSSEWNGKDVRTSLLP